MQDTNVNYCINGVMARSVHLEMPIPKEAYGKPLE